MTKKVLIAGFYGAFNAGDEFMLGVLLKHLSKSKLIDIYILNSNKENIINPIYKSKYKSILYPKNNEEIKKLSYFFDGVIWGGGAILSDKDYQSKKELSLQKIFIDLNMEFLNQKKKVFCIGLSSIEKIKNKDYIYKLQFIIDHSNYFSLRCKFSKKTLEKVGIKCTKLKIINDIAISGVCNVKKVSKNKIGFVFIYNEKTYDIILKFIRNIIKNEQYENKKLLFIPFYSYNKNDIIYIKRIIKDLNLKKVEVSVFPYTSSDFVNIIKEVDALFSMRYHATLISSILNIETYCINYSMNHDYFNKNKEIFRRYNKNKKNIIDIKMLHKFNLENFIEKKQKKINTNYIINKSSKELSKIINKITKEIFIC